MTRGTTVAAVRALARRGSVRVLLGFAGALVVTVLSWLGASAASAAEEPGQPGEPAPLTDLVGAVTEPVAPVHDTVQALHDTVHETVRVVEAIVPPLRPDRVIAELTGGAPLFEPSTNSGADAEPEVHATKPRPPQPDREPPAPREPEPGVVQSHAPAAPASPVRSAPADAAEHVPAPGPAAPGPAAHHDPDDIAPLAPPPVKGSYSSSTHSADNPAPNPALPVPPPMPLAVAGKPSSHFVEYTVDVRPRVSPD